MNLYDLACHLDRLSPGRLLVCLDGSSGAGKTTASRILVDYLRCLRGFVHLVHMDDFYPGWEGLEKASELLPLLISSPHPSYQHWDWARNCPSDRVFLDPHSDLFIEGCGAITTSSASLSTCSIWMQADEKIRKERALKRDGKTYAPYWTIWADQEKAHRERHRPDLLADIVIDTSDGVKITFPKKR